MTDVKIMNYYNFYSYCYHIITIMGGKSPGKEDGLVSQGSNTPAQGGAHHNDAFWETITQMQGVPEKGPTSKLPPAGRGVVSRLQPPRIVLEVNSLHVSSLIALSFLNSFLS